jgi:hypothetical protein
MGTTSWIPGGVTVAVVLLVAAWFVLGLARWPTRVPAAPAPATVRAGKDGLEIDGHLVPRAQLRDAFLLRGPLHVHVRKLSGQTIVVHVGDVQEGHALLRALGLDVSQTVAELQTDSPSKWRHAGGFVGFVALYATARALVHRLGVPPSWGLDVAIAVVIGLALRRLNIAKIRVGSEGIEIRWVWTRRFLRYEEIETLERETTALRIALASGEEVRVPGDVPTLELLEARILEARRRSRKGDPGARSRRGDSGVVATFLRRGDRSVGAWIAALRSLGAGANAGPRTAPVPRERLFRVVEDPALSARDRAAAAVALGIELDEDDRARLRAAAGSTAMPRLRVAIETAASGAEQAELEAALAELDEEGVQPTRARS